MEEVAFSPAELGKVHEISHAGLAANLPPESPRRPAAPACPPPEPPSHVGDAAQQHLQALSLFAVDRAGANVVDLAKAVLRSPMVWAGNREVSIGDKRRRLRLGVVLAMVVTTSGAGGPPAHADAPRPKAPSDLKADGWTLVTESDDTLVYMRDLEGAMGPVRRVWTAYDSHKRRDHEGFKFSSVRSLGEFDCARGLTRVLREIFYGSPGLQGRAWAPTPFEPTEWSAPEAGSVGEIRLSFACRPRSAA